MNQTFYRKANITSAEAKAALAKKFPGSKLVSFSDKIADKTNAKVANAEVGELIFEATLKLAEFPPSEWSSERRRTSRTG